MTEQSTLYSSGGYIQIDDKWTFLSIGAMFIGGGAVGFLSYQLFTLIAQFFLARRAFLFVIPIHPATYAIPALAVAICGGPILGKLLWTLAPKTYIAHDGTRTTKPGPGQGHSYFWGSNRFLMGTVIVTVIPAVLSVIMCMNVYIGADATSVSTSSFFQLNSTVHPYSELEGIHLIESGNILHYEFYFQNNYVHRTSNTNFQSILAQYASVADYIAAQAGIQVETVILE